MASRSTSKQKKLKMKAATIKAKRKRLEEDTGNDVEELEGGEGQRPKRVSRLPKRYREDTEELSEGGEDEDEDEYTEGGDGGAGSEDEDNGGGAAASEPIEVCYFCIGT